MADETPPVEGTGRPARRRRCRFCAEDLPAGERERCPSCGESLAERSSVEVTGWGSPSKPAGIAVIAALNLVFGGLTAVSIPVSIVMLFYMGSLVPPGAMGPVMSSPEYRAFMMVGLVLGGIGAAAQLSSGMGLLYLRAWARKVALGWAGFSVVWTLLSSVVSYVLITLPMLRSMPPGSPAATGGAIGGAIGGMIGPCFGLIFPVATLVVLTRPRVIAAIERAEAERTAH